MKSRVVFADEKLKEAFNKLKDSKTEDKKLYEWLNRASSLEILIDDCSF